MTKKRLTIEAPKTNESWLSIVKDFDTKVKEPFDAAWALLSKDEKKIFATINTDEHEKTIFENAPF